MYASFFLLYTISHGKIDPPPFIDRSNPEIVDKHSLEVIVCFLILVELLNLTV